MAEYVIVNWSDKMVSELNPTDAIEAYIQGIEVGKSGDDVALYQVNVSPPVQRYPKPEPEPQPMPEPEPEPAPQPEMAPVSV